MGTADPVVNYDGAQSFSGAVNAFEQWAQINGCSKSELSRQRLPILVKDGTHVILHHDAGCSSQGEVDLYTVVNGGHAWPGSVRSGWGNGGGLGLDSQNLDTTTTIGNFAQLWTTGSTH
jgi:poly(3-hydroxybutyrate) depolymerase